MLLMPPWTNSKNNETGMKCGDFYDFKQAVRRHFHSRDVRYLQDPLLVSESQDG